MSIWGILLPPGKVYVSLTIKLMVETVSEKEPKVEEESSVLRSALQRIQAYTQEERPQAMETSTAELPDGCPATETEEMSTVLPCQQQQQNIEAVDAAPTSDQATDELSTVKQELDESVEVGEEIFFDEDGGEDEITFYPVNSFQHPFNNSKMVLPWSASQ